MVKLEEENRTRMAWFPFFFFFIFSFFVFFFLTLLFAMDFVPHPAMVTRKVGAEATVPFISLENWHVPGERTYSRSYILQCILAFEIFELYICLWFKSNSRVVIYLLYKEQNNPSNSLSSICIKL